jgi:hypothetical protein
MISIDEMFGYLIKGLKLSTIVSIGENHVSSKDSIEYFIKANMLWFVAVILIILGLCIYIIKADGTFNLVFIHNPMIRLTSGLLIILEGIINLSNKVSVLLLNIQTFHQSKSLLLGEEVDGIIRNTLISSIIPILINLLQILAGLYFVLYQKKNKEI